MTEPIMVGVDGSGRSLRALVWAAHEAMLRRRPLHIVHVLLPAHSYATTDEGRAWEASNWDRGVMTEATAIAQEAHPNLKVTSSLRSGRPAAVLLAEGEHAHTVVLGAKGMGGFGSLLLGSVATQVVGHAVCPVVIVNHVATAYDRIVVGVDGSAHSEAALAYAFEQASLRGAELQAVHSWSHPGPHAVVSAAQDALAKEQLQALEEWLAPLRERYPAVEVVEQVPDEPPVIALSRASDRADLLVVGSRGLGGFHGLALGSVSHHLLQFSQCPLAVIRPRPE
ncbi:universal stress protein [Streptomyces chromofuscus]|uniref:Universal stress protein n=1 Tax=Streptomyces chromofuscus TaxID=42881 RepID=A0A7M2T9K1_STRCW|nr:universal stress protein [Streptomyces chromofuscus]QOV44615.1 universal stress protein [Streptomyces chromofuscus]GGT01845.1 universal stress protein [Streptomyces chromofuscus]